jgi:integrase
MGSVYRPTRLDPTTGKRVKYRKYRIAYIDENGKRVTEKAFTDRQASQALLARREKDVERKKVGLPVEEPGKLREDWTVPRDLFLAELQRLERTERHVRDTKNVLRRVFEGCSWSCLGDVKRDELSRWLGLRRKEGIAPRTLNHNFERLACFVSWCRQEGWMLHDPLAGFQKSPVGENTPGRTRALTLDEFRRLIELPRHGTTYEVAGLSGLRRSELARLERRDVDLSDLDRPLWRLRASATKGRRSDVVPMLPDCLPAIQRVLNLSNTEPTARLFPLLLDWKVPRCTG